MRSVSENNWIKLDGRADSRDSKVVIERDRALLAGKKYSTTGVKLQ